MPRPRTFDEERALDAAMRIFWRQGYEATSTQDLCAATGLGRSSVYNTFISKRALFLRVLARYLDRMTHDQLDILRDTSLSPRERLGAFLATIIEVEESNRREGGHGIGCFGVNTSVELSGRDADVDRLLKRDTDRRLAALREVIAEGQRAGDIAKGRRPEEAALLVNAVIAGMRVSARNGADRAVLESIAAGVVSTLRG